MSEVEVWLLVFGTLLVAYAILLSLGFAGAGNRADDFFLAGRQAPAWVFVPAATVLSLTGWLAIGHPGMPYRDGFPYAEAALGAVVIPLAGILFLKRQWLLQRRFGYATPASMFGDYYQGQLIRVLTVLIALVFAIPFVGMQLAAAGRLIELLTGGAVGWQAAMWILAFSIFIYIYLGGMRAVMSVGVLQCLLTLAGITAIGCFAYIKAGGFEALNVGLAKLGATPGATSLFEISGVIQFTAGLGREAPAGGIWTSAMILSYAFALMGIQASPTFSMLAFSCRDTRGFAAQQVWAMGVVVGVVLVFLAVAPGLGAHLLWASPASPGTSLAGLGALPHPGSDRFADVTGGYIRLLADQYPWLAALVAICVVAAIQMAAAAYVSTSATMLTNDLYRRHIRPHADDRAQRIFARASMAVLFIIALAMATFWPSALNQLGALALGFALQLWPVLAGICWLPWISRNAATLGLSVGLFAVVLTEPLGASIAHFFGLELPWGRWPWTIHSAGWGIFFNLLVCAVVSLVTRGGEERRHRDGVHEYLRERAGMSAHKQFMRPAAWALTLIWMFFAIGPGAVIGNNLFGESGGGLSAWRLGIPSLWAWQIVWWLLGVFVIWWLAYKMELATAPHEPTDLTKKPELHGIG